jgi:pyruvate/2-oxoacid:ferredoxin oxidoreductase alpha subunit
MFRPFPVKRVREALGGAERVVVIDRNCSFGSGGGFASELKAALYNSENGHPVVFGYIAGIGGQDVTPDLVTQMVDDARSLDRPPREDIWMGVQP